MYTLAPHKFFPCQSTKYLVSKEVYFCNQSLEGLVRSYIKSWELFKSGVGQSAFEAEDGEGEEEWVHESFLVEGRLFKLNFSFFEFIDFFIDIFEIFSVLCGIAFSFGDF